MYLKMGYFENVVFWRLDELAFLNLINLVLNVLWLLLLVPAFMMIISLLWGPAVALLLAPAGRVLPLILALNFKNYMERIYPHMGSNL